MPQLFDPLTIRGLTLRNRIVVSPMCQYSAGTDATPNDWHLVHLGSRAVGGAGLVITEATAVESRGRISEADLGLYTDLHTEAFARIVRFCRAQGAAVGVQLAHAGRKAWSGPSWDPRRGVGPEPAVAPSPIPFDEGWPPPRELDRAGIDAIVAAFRRATQRALEADFDLIEIHGAHGYLISEFLSPLANQRTDEYGGSLENRMRFLLRVVDAVRGAWPEERPLFVRLSCTDWAPGGITIDETVEVARALKSSGVDLVDCSSGGNAARPEVPLGPGYQTPFAERIRREVGIRTGAVGLITDPAQAAEIIHNGRADVVILARAMLRDPYWPLHAAYALGLDVAWPQQYHRAKPVPPPRDPGARDRR